MIILTRHPIESHLFVGVSEALQLNFTSLNIVWVSVELHFACHIKVDPRGIANLGVLVHSYRGRPNKVGRNPKLFGLVNEDVGNPKVSGSRGVQRHIFQLVVVTAAATRGQVVCLRSVVLSNFDSEKQDK